jgi:Uma2 family endonuclease
MADTLAIDQLGPEHDGLHMTLDEFRAVEFEEGYVFELDRGVVVVSKVPHLHHMLVLQAIRDALVLYRAAHPGRVFAVTGGAESGMEMPEMQSRRHPDISAYLTPPPVPDAQPWEAWIPEITVEVVSASSQKRDYERKPHDYLDAGVKLYWIVDPLSGTVTVHTRHADRWHVTKLDETGVLTTGLLPGFSLALQQVFSILAQ